MTVETLITRNAAELSELIRRRDVSAREVVDAFIDRIDTMNPRLNAFITVTHDLARQRAGMADDEMRRGKYRGALHGIPYAAKDVFATKDILTTNGSRATAQWIPTIESTATERMNAAGAILVGKLNLWEFAVTGAAYGEVRNPWASTHSAGGSSSGAGAAVAARLVPLALGTDTGGSIRVPAAYCGLVGLRPTYGRVSRYGVTPNAWSVDTAGPITTTVHDAALVLQAIAGADRRDRTSSAVPVPDYATTIGAGVNGLRIGIARDHFFDRVHGDVERAVRDAAAVLEQHGAKIVEARLPHAAFAAVARTLHLAEAASFHEERLRKEPHLLGTVLRRRLEAARSYLAVDYVKALRLRSVLVDEMSRAFDACDVLVVPTDRNLPPPLSPEPAGRGQGTAPRTGDAAGSNTFLASMTGVPAMAVPCGFSAASPRLPVSVMLHARPFQESLLFRVGHAFQAATGWHRMVPAVDV